MISLNNDDDLAYYVAYSPKPVDSVHLPSWVDCRALGAYSVDSCTQRFDVLTFISTLVHTKCNRLQRAFIYTEQPTVLKGAQWQH